MDTINDNAPSSNKEIEPFDVYKALPRALSSRSIHVDEDVLVQSTSSLAASGGAAVDDMPPTPSSKKKGDVNSSVVTVPGTPIKGEEGGLVLLGSLLGERQKRRKRIEYAASTRAADVMRALRPTTPILALDVERSVLAGAARLRPDAADAVARVEQLGAVQPRAKGELRALTNWCASVSARQVPLAVLYSVRDDCVEILVRTLN